MKALIFQDCEGRHPIAVAESDDSQRLGEEIGSEIHQTFVDGWRPDKIIIEFQEGERDRG